MYSLIDEAIETYMNSNSIKLKINDKNFDRLDELLRIILKRKDVSYFKYGLPHLHYSINEDGHSVDYISCYKDNLYGVRYSKKEFNFYNVCDSAYNFNQTTADNKLLECQIEINRINKLIHNELVSFLNKDDNYNIALNDSEAIRAKKHTLKDYVNSFVNNIGIDLDKISKIIGVKTHSLYFVEPSICSKGCTFILYAKTDDYYDIIKRDSKIIGYLEYSRENNKFKFNEFKGSKCLTSDITSLKYLRVQMKNKIVKGFKNCGV